MRRRFDPDDLELDAAGVLHADVSFGVIRGASAGRWLVPDFDIDLALSDNIELGADGAIALEGTTTSPWAFDHGAPDNLWLNTKIGLYRSGDPNEKDKKAPGWAFGAQLGPRVGFTTKTRGAGFAGLLLLGYKVNRFRTVLNVGGLVDPGTRITSDRPVAALVGIDGSLDLDAKGTWSVIGDVSAILFTTTGDPSQIAVTVGPVLAVTTWLDVSLNALVGLLAGGDRYGGFLQVSPKIPIF